MYFFHYVSLVRTRQREDELNQHKICCRFMQIVHGLKHAEYILVRNEFTEEEEEQHHNYGKSNNNNNNYEHKNFIFQRIICAECSILSLSVLIAWLLDEFNLCWIYEIGIYFWYCSRCQWVSLSLRLCVCIFKNLCTFGDLIIQCTSSETFDLSLKLAHLERLQTRPSAHAQDFHTAFTDVIITVIGLFSAVTKIK